MKLKRQQLISQGSLNRLTQAALVEWNNKKFQEAINLMERACRLDPANVNLTMDLGRFYALRYDATAAERCFEKAVRMSPNKTETLAIAGLNCRDAGSFELSERYYLRAIEQTNVRSETIVQLANLYERLRRSNEASDMVDRALHLNRYCSEALLTRARLERQAGQIETAEQTILLGISSPNPDVWIHAQLWYEYGAILDRLEKYDDAINAFVQAKTLIHPHSTRLIADLKIVRQRISIMQAGLTAETFQRWFDTAPLLSSRMRLALLGGHPRSGTTLLEQVLDSHSDIISVEETTIFHDDAYMPILSCMPDETPILSFLEPALINTLQYSRANYFHSAEAFLGQQIQGRLLVDKNPSLTFLIPPMLRIFPETKLLIALRDPRDVVLSCFMQPLRPEQGNAAYQRIQTTVEEYTAMMGLWQTIKPMLEGHFLEIRYEDMVEDLETAARKTLNFLDVAWNAKVLNFDAHARQKVVRSPTYADVTKPLYRGAVGRWRNYQKYLEPHLAKLEPFVKAFGYE